MVRLKDIAALAGVSVMTVSKSLRDESDVSPATRLRIKNLAEQMGYVPNSSAQGLRTRTTKLLGLVVSSVTNPIFSRVVSAIEGRAYELGYEVLLAHSLNLPEREEACVLRMLARHVDGLIISPVYRMGTEARVYQLLAGRKIPTVLLGHPAPFCGQFLHVASDDLQGGYFAAQHLLKLGHQRIAFISGPPAVPSGKERFEGYRRALREAGLDVDDSLVFQGGRTIEDGAKAALQMMNESCPATAVQTTTDLVALGCAQSFLQQGLKIPDDISVVGFGNIMVSEHFCVPLTTVRQPKFQLGVAAMDLMQNLLLGKRAESKRLSAELVVRASSGIVPAREPLAHLKAKSVPAV